MTKDEVIAQLESLYENSKIMADQEFSDEIWSKDLEALEVAIEAVKNMEEV